jgi:hypothetical protein
VDGTVGHGDDPHAGAEVDDDLKLKLLSACALGDEQAVVEEPEVARLLAQGVDAEVHELAVSDELARTRDEKLGSRL